MSSQNFAVVASNAHDIPEDVVAPPSAQTHEEIDSFNMMFDALCVNITLFGLVKCENNGDND